MVAVTSVQQFTDTVPASTAKTSPRTLQCQLGPKVVQWVELEIPPGPAGNLGLYVASSGVQIIPQAQTGTPMWLVLDNRTVHWDVTNLPDSGDFQIVAYNTDLNNHTYWVRFGLTEIVAPVPVLSIVPSATLSGTIST